MRRKVQVWIFSGSHCLLLKTNEARGSFWQPVTGSVEEGEDFATAAQREAAEETGLPFTGPFKDINYEFEFETRYGGTATERVYAAQVPPQCPSPTLDPQEHQSFQWSSPTEALAALKFPANQEGLKRAHALVFGKSLVLFLFLIAALLGAVPRAQAAQDAVVLNEGAAIRANPESNATIIETHKSGDTLRISSESKEGWFKTRTSSGQFGWIHQTDVSPHAFESTLNYGAIDRKPRAGRSRREDDYPTLGIKGGIGPAVIFPSDLNRVLGSPPLRNYTGTALLGQISYFLKDDLRLFVRLEHLSASGQTLSYKLDFKSNLTYAGLEFDLFANTHWRTFWGFMLGAGIADSVSVTAVDQSALPNSTTISGTPLAAALSIGAQYSLFSWFALSAETGLRYAQNISANSVNNAFAGDAPFFNNGTILTPVKITETGPFIFLGAELTF